MTRKLLVGAIAAGAFAITAGTAFALTGDDSTTPAPGQVASTSTTSSSTTSTSTTTTPSTNTPPSAASAPELTADDARRIVHARYGGTVREVERELEHGRVEWDVEIDAADGHHYEVRIDAQSGEITRVEQDDRDDDHGDDRDDDSGKDSDKDDDDRYGDDD